MFLVLTSGGLTYFGKFSICFKSTDLLVVVRISIESNMCKEIKFETKVGGLEHLTTAMIIPECNRHTRRRLPSSYFTFPYLNCNSSYPPTIGTGRRHVCWHSGWTNVTIWYPHRDQIWEFKRRQIHPRWCTILGSRTLK